MLVDLRKLGDGAIIGTNKHNHRIDSKRKFNIEE